MTHDRIAHSPHASCSATRRARKARSRRTDAGCPGSRPRTACSISGLRRPATSARRASSPTTGSAASASTAGPTDSTHVLYFQDEGGTEDWHVYAVPVDGRRVARPHAAAGRQRPHAGAEPRSSPTSWRSGSTTATRPGTTSTASISAPASASCCSRTARSSPSIVLDRQLRPRLAAKSRDKEGGQHRLPHRRQPSSSRSGWSSTRTT